MAEVNGTRCCAKCKSPYGHVAAAGQCCHPVTSLAVWQRLREQYGLEAADAPPPARPPIPWTRKKWIWP